MLIRIGWTPNAPPWRTEARLSSLEDGGATLLPEGRRCDAEGATLPPEGRRCDAEKARMPQLQLSHVYPEMECCSCSCSCCETVMQQYTRNRGSLQRSHVDDGGGTLLCGGRGGGTFFFGGRRGDAPPWKTEDGAYPWTGGATLLRVGRMEAESSSVEDIGVPPL